MASVLLLLACFPPLSLGFLAWVALVPVLCVLPRLSWRGVEWLGFLTGYVFYAVSFRWLWPIFGLPAVSLWGLLALFFAIFCVLVRTIPEKAPIWQRTLLTACFWVAVEYFRCEQWPLRFSWLALGYSQHNQWAILQWASYVGVYGLSFLLLSGGAAIAAVLRRERAGAAHLLYAAAPLAAMLWLTGQIIGVKSRLDAREEGITMHAIAVQTPHPSLGPLAHWTQQGTAALPESTKGIVPTLAVWPEYSFEFDARGDDGTWQALQKVARDTGTALVVGSVHERGNDRYSSAAYVVDAGGRSLGLYEKHNPLPFFQDGEPGTGYPLFRIPGRVHPSRQALDVGALICFDLSFERNARVLARGGASVLAVPSTDPCRDALLHAQHATVAPLRAVENRCVVVRASGVGVSQVVSPHGEVVASLPAGRSGPLAVPWLRAYRTATVFNRVGWVLPWVSQFVTVVWVLGRLPGRRECYKSKIVRLLVDPFRTRATHFYRL